MDRPDFLSSPVPIVTAPMAGGPSTVALARAVHEVGAFPFLAAGYKTVEALAAEIAQVRTFTDRFGVNLFVPGESRVDGAAYRRYAASLQPAADRYGVVLPPMPVEDDDHWPAKLALLLVAPVPVVSLTFGLPKATEIAALQRAGTHVLASVTSAAEAAQAQRAGVDGLVVQGSTAGGHSATFDPATPPTMGSTADLVRDVRRVCLLPLVAAGGVARATDVRALLDAGAVAVAIGTLLLRTLEAGTSQTHREALVDPRFGETVLTHAFTGRPARALRNAFIDRHGDAAPLGYPALHHLTRPIRQAAAQRGEPDDLHLWAGTGFRQAPDRPAGEVIRLVTGQSLG